FCRLGLRRRAYQKSVMSKSGRYPRLFAAAFACLALFPVLVRAHTTIDLSGATRTANGDGTYTSDTWKPILAPQGWTYTSADGYLYYANNGQPTGPSASDFAGTAPLPSFFIQAGKIDGVDVIAFRVIFDAFDSGIASKKYNGNPVNVRVGVDANFDGKIDL